MKEKKSILLHICCGPCAIYPLSFFREMNLAVTMFFYNPNIHPYKEYQRRLNTLKDFNKDFNKDYKSTLIVQEAYNELNIFLQELLNNEANRCEKCYTWRLRKVAEYAKNNGFQSFSTSLLVSPYQKHDLIKNAGEQAAEEFAVEFLYYDLRAGWNTAMATAKEREYYRQPYCGCIFSEKERYYTIKTEGRVDVIR